MSEIRRNVYSVPGNMQADLEAIIDRCKIENGGKVVGEPSLRVTGKSTVLEVTEHPWWEENMRIYYRRLTLMGVNQFTNKDQSDHVSE